MIEFAFFDLDGTLTDSRPGILAGAAYALGRLGIKTQAEEVSTGFIGPPLYDSFRRYYGLDDANARRAVTFYREYYGEKGLFENRVYEGAEAMLLRLGNAGCRLFVATGKPWQYAERILRAFGLARFFEKIYGAEFDGTRTDKGELLAYALHDSGVPAEQSVMIGDRSYDMHAARENGTTALGVLWGYGSRGELLDAGAQILAGTPEETARQILGKNEKTKPKGR